MAKKEAILENVEQYTADELVKYVKDGVVTFEELCNDTGGYFPANVRKEVNKKLEGSEEEDWAKAMGARNIDDLDKYLVAYPQGSHREEARRLIGEIEAEQKQQEEDSEWNKVNKNRIKQLKQFIDQYPDSPRVTDARARINQLKRQRAVCPNIDALKNKIKSMQTDPLSDDNERKKVIVAYVKDAESGEIIEEKRREVLGMIEDDKNILKSTVVNLLLEEGIFTTDELVNAGVDQRFINELLRGTITQAFGIPQPLSRIEKDKTTEVYFWGIPSSGKSCALGAILSVAGNGSVASNMATNKCQGLGYMTRLSQLFHSNGCVGRLPEGTPVSSTYEMSFDLQDFDGNVHPLTLIDLAGELVRCMYKDAAQETLTDDERNSLDTLKNILVSNRTVNRKIHFFVIDYGAESRLYEGLSQDVYLSQALQYIQRMGIFNKDTDAIYVMITKVDKARGEGNLQTVLRKYIEENYKGFYNGIKSICERYSINAGNAEIIPFTLGQVCFQDYCLFNDKPAAEVVRVLLGRSKGFGMGRINSFISKLKL